MAEEYGEPDSQAAKDPLAALVQLREELKPDPAVGQIWWLPERHVGHLKRPANDAYCLMALAERNRSGEIVQLHYIAGSRRVTTGSSTLRLDPDENGLYEVTYYKFWDARDLPPTTIRADGTWYGNWPQDRLPEIEAAIRASNIIRLKRLLDG